MIVLESLAFLLEIEHVYSMFLSVWVARDKVDLTKLVNMSDEEEFLDFELSIFVFGILIAALIKVLLDFLYSVFLMQIDLMGFNIHQNNQHLW